MLPRPLFSYLGLLLVGCIASHGAQLDFNTLQVGEEVRGYYNGGFGSMGAGPGPNLGVTFSNDFVTVNDGVFGPPFLAEELTSGSGIMDLEGGFSGAFSF